LNLLLPGLGHVYWREPVFGLFVFLVTLIAIVLFFLTFFVHLSILVKVILFGLPAIFYLFTFVDLDRTVRQARGKTARSLRTAVIYFVIALSYQLVVPIAPGNFLLRNIPEAFMLENNSLAPLYSSGDLLRTNRLAYTADIFFVDRPVLHALPQRYDAVRFIDDDDRQRCGFVVGLPNEEIEILEGIVIVNGLPDYEGSSSGWNLSGDCSLTWVQGYSILVVTLNFGSIDQVYELPLERLEGKVSKLL
jgi:amino acid transporter